VPAYRQGANAGGNAFTDQAGDPWAADRAYTAGSFGYQGISRTVSTNAAIAGTTDDRLYQDARTGEIEYRFDGLAPGVYQVELRFAEIEQKKPFRRTFDVAIEGGVALFGHDIANEVGQNTADDHSFYVVMTENQLNIRFLTRRGFGLPIINAVRVTHRPDR
jgi:hypothetical protein